MEDGSFFASFVLRRKVEIEVNRVVEDHRVCQQVRSRRNFLRTTGTLNCANTIDAAVLYEERLSPKRNGCV